MIIKLIFSSILNSISRDIVILFFQLQEFVKNKHVYVDLFSEKNRRFLNYIIFINFRFFQINRRISTRDDKIKKRFQFIESRSWLVNWIVDKSSFRVFLKSFEKNTKFFRRL